MRLLSILGACALSAAALSATDANAAPNLIANGSFETGDFTGWTANAVSFPMYIVSPTGVPNLGPVEDGQYAAQIAGYSLQNFPQYGGPDTLTQTVGTTNGVDYTLSFWVYQQNTGPVTFLDVTWDGTTVFSNTWLDTGDIPYQNYTVQVVGTGSDVLQFISAYDPGYTYLDNVSLTSGVPEPATWAMMMLGFAGLGFAGYRKGKSARTALAT